MLDPRCCGVPRSSRWPVVRAIHLADHPECAACGTRRNVEVHHLKPVHLRPDLELDRANLLTLCESPSHNCHLWVGHCGDWKSYNPHAVSDAAACLARLIEIRGHPVKEEPVMATKAATAMMVAAGIDFDWAERQVNHVVHLLSTQGMAAKQTVLDILATVKFFTGHQFLQALAMLSQDVADVEAIIAAIKAEFAN